MPRRFLPTLSPSRRAGRGMQSKTLETKPAPDGASEMKVVLADYYHALSSAGLYDARRSRPWPVERAVAEVYERLVWVFKSVDAIAGHASRLPVKLKNGEDVVTDHPLYRVLNTGRANPLETGRQFRKRLSAQLLLSKRGAFIEVTRTRGGDVARMDLLPPGRTRPVPSRNAALIDHYEVVRADGTKTEIDAENVRWFRDPHPLDPYCGVTPLEAAGLSAELDFFTRMYNRNFFLNDARPGGILGIDGDMDEDEMDRVEDRFGAGPLEAGKLTVINGKISYVDVAAKPRDMQHEATARSAKVEILTAFGVPESVIGYAADRTFDNADAELYNFWTITMLPHLDLLATGLDEDSDDDLETFLDTSDVEVLQRPKIARRAEMREEFDRGLLSPDEYREEAGYDPVDNYQTRALYIPSGKTPVPTSDKDAEAFGLGPAQPAAPPPPPPGAGPPAGPPGNGPQPPAQPPAAGGGRQAAPPGGPQPPGGARQNGQPQQNGRGAPARKDAQGHRAPARHAVTRRAVTLTEVKAAAPPERVSDIDMQERSKLETAVSAALAALAARLTERAIARAGSPKQRKGTRHWVAQYDHDTRIGAKALDAARIADAATWRTEAEQTVTPIITAAAHRAARALLDDLAPGTGVDPAARVDEVAAQIVELVGTAAERQADVLADLIAQADRNGRSVEEIGDLVRDHARRLTGWADRVAATAATATTAGSRDAAAQHLADHDPNTQIHRMWLTRLDDKVRDTHHGVHGKHQPLGEPFTVGDALLRYPGDPFGPPGETINCRCMLQHRARMSGQYVTAPAGELTRAPALAAAGAEGKAAVGGRHVPGTPYNWRHGWIPLNAETARRHDKPWPPEGGGAQSGGAQGGGSAGGAGKPESLLDAFGDAERVKAAVAAVAAGIDLPDGVTVGEIKAGKNGWILNLQTPDGAPVARFERSRPGGSAQGKKIVYHADAEVRHGWRKKGIATAVNRAFEDWYRESGIEKVVLQAAGGGDYNGGYTWARAGYDWDAGAMSEEEADRIRQVVVDIAFDAEEEDVQEEAQRILEAMDTDDYTAWPTPAEIAALGYTPGATEWIGKTGMAGVSWPGVKWLNTDGGGKPPVASLKDVVDDEAKLADAVREVAGRVSLPAGVRVGEVKVSGRQWTLRLETPGGDRVAEFVRAAERVSKDPKDLGVRHRIAQVEDDWQKKGIATAVNSAFEDWYRDSGIEQINLTAAGGGSKNGGYTWARAGYDWDEYTSQAEVTDMLKDLRKAADGDAQLEQQADEWSEQVTANPYETTMWPTPAELAAFGYRPGADDWPGKTVMKKQTWAGTKWLTKK